jgi:hypothetical protein
VNFGICYECSTWEALDPVGQAAVNLAIRTRPESPPAARLDLLWQVRTNPKARSL